MSFDLRDHQAFLLSVFAMGGAFVALAFRTCLSSRCQSIKCCGSECTRRVLEDVDLNTIQVEGRLQNSHV